MQTVEQVIERIRAAVEALPEYGKPVHEIRMSSSGDCPRMLDFAAQYGRKPIPFDNAIRMRMGDAVHEMMQELFRLAFPDEFVGCEEEVTIKAPWGEIKGHPDGLVKPFDAVLEIKTVSNETFKLIENLGHALPSHFKQGNLYAKALGAANVLPLYVNRSSGELRAFLVPFSEAQAMETIAMFGERIWNAQSGAIAPRPHKDPTAAPCWFCDHKERCYEGFKAEVDGLPVGSVYQSEHVVPLFSAAELASKAREERLKAEKVEETSRGQALSYMLDHLQVKAARIQGADIAYDISVSVGKTGKPSATIKLAKGREA